MAEAIAFIEAAFVLKPALLSDTTSALADMLNPKNTIRRILKNCKKVGDGWIEFDPTMVALLMANEVT